LNCVERYRLVNACAAVLRNNRSDRYDSQQRGDDDNDKGSVQHEPLLSCFVWLSVLLYLWLHSMNLIQELKLNATTLFRGQRGQWQMT
jgi:hypothetical protein